MNSNHSVQALVIGAGPAGSRAAEALALQGIDTLLLERKPRVGIPVRCGEGIGEKGLYASGLFIQDKWIQARVSKAVFSSPSGIQIPVEKMVPGFILDRSLFDNDLAQNAKQQGADLLLGTTVLRVRRDQKTWIVEAQTSGVQKLYRAELLILADGVESRMGRQIGLCRTISDQDLEVCSQIFLENAGLRENCCHFYVGSQWAPGGYAWAFPKGNGRANVGLGVLAKYARGQKPYALLQNFLKVHFPEAKIIRTTHGSVPVGMCLDRLAADGVMIVGDAARQVNCLNGGGLAYSLAAGRMAGEIGGRALKQGDLSQKRLMKYQKEWEKFLGKQQARSFHLKEALLELKDADIDRIAGEMRDKGIQPSLSMLGVFSRFFWKNPMLLWKLFRLLS